MIWGILVSFGGTFTLAITLWVSLDMLDVRLMADIPARNCATCFL